MNDTLTDKTIRLGQMLPELANAVQELHAMIEGCQSPELRTYLKVFRDGLLTIPDQPADPYLVPLALDNPHFIHKGGPDVGDLTWYRDGEYLRSFWQNNSFLHRLAFLQTGTMVLSILGTAFAPTNLRLDPAACGLEFEPAEFIDNGDCKANPRTENARFVVNALLKHCDIVTPPSMTGTLADLIRVKVAPDGSLNKEDCNKYDYGHHFDAWRYLLFKHCRHWVKTPEVAKPAPAFQ